MIHNWRKLWMISLGFLLALLVSLTGFVPAAQAQSPCGSTYVVRARDTLTRIARQCDTTVAQLLNANPAITNRNLIRVGQVIRIPTSSTQPPDGTGYFVIHTVQRGEWLSRIARQYNTTVSAILAINPDITNPNRVSVGQRIRVPTTGAPQFTRVTIYLIALDDGGRRGPLIGCNDSIVPVEVRIEPTVAPLRAAMQQLLMTSGHDYGLTNVFSGSNLTVQDVNIRDGEAIIHLSGRLNIGGVCDHPRIVEQLERTALQFSTVNRVSIFVNGEPLSRILDLR
jgi:LysM repeat protein